ncbi:hypothetical protein [Phycicoccus sp. Soil803]|uniref:hypothetical protein n=1 Tax=Phycicoccus sp. Soil803 TaxID=1736415 RepID=UPI000708A572|nr:hypothetical protein [Phycicoccus sp. Soil803]KRF26370.1 hypothetical protein ASG95_19410 [Phycicoccus sp. Soil803]
MPNDTAPTVPEPRRTLAELAEDVRTARGEVAARRMSPVTQTSLLSARRELLRVMELYADELAARRLPVPHQLRDDLRLLREIRGNPGSDWHRRGRAL